MSYWARKNSRDRYKYRASQIPQGVRMFTRFYAVSNLGDNDIINLQEQSKPEDLPEEVSK